MKDLLEMRFWFWVPDVKNEAVFLIKFDLIFHHIEKLLYLFRIIFHYEITGFVDITGSKPLPICAPVLRLTVRIEVVRITLLHRIYIAILPLSLHIKIYRRCLTVLLHLPHSTQHSGKNEKYGPCTQNRQVCDSGRFSESHTEQDSAHYQHYTYNGLKTYPFRGSSHTFQCIVVFYQGIDMLLESVEKCQCSHCHPE